MTEPATAARRLERAKDGFRGDSPWSRPLCRPADDDSPWMGPYCMAPYCHNSHTAHYLTAPGNGTNGVPDVRMKVAYFAPTTFPGSERLCRSHALLRHGVAFG